MLIQPGEAALMQAGLQAAYFMRPERRVGDYQFVDKRDRILAGMVRLTMRTRNDREARHYCC